jgi:DNA topoisomerase I
MDDSPAAARAAGLRYVNDGDPGITRRRHGRGFSYVNAAGSAVRDRATLRRIRSLAIPPAWSDVWISPTAGGHIQATGRDERGRKQYLYHALWREVRDETKYDRTVAFARALPRLRKHVARDLARGGLPRQKVVAVVVQLLETTLLRVGNEEYVRENRSFGLTTLRNRHVAVEGAQINFSFRAKSGKAVNVDLRDRRLARVMRELQELPGQRVFQYVDDDGQVQPIESEDVNAYLRMAMGDDFSAKDFRTWAGTVLAASALIRLDEDADGDPTPTKGRLVEAVKEVARSLGNTPAVCRRSYIHPDLADAYLDGSLARAARRAIAGHRGSRRDDGLDDQERLVFDLLRRRSSRAAAAA